MTYDVRAISGYEAIAAISTIKQLLSEFSDDVGSRIAAGQFDQLIKETCLALNVRVCIVWDSDISQAVGMYIATVMPVMLGRRLYVDSVVVAQSHRRQGICQTVLIPHMDWLAAALECHTIELTSSKPGPQTLYRASGFGSPTTVFRKQIAPQ